MARRRARRSHTPVCKAKVALPAVKGEKTLIGLAQQFDVHPNRLNQWKDQLAVEGPAVGISGRVYSAARRGRMAHPSDLKELHATIKQLALANDFYSGALAKPGRSPSARR